MNDECKEMEKLIPAFLEDDLTNAQLRRFLEHVESCENCREELTIQILTQVGTKRLEDGKAFHLGDELDATLKDAHAKLRRRRRLEQAALVAQAAVFVAVMILAVLMVLLL